MLLSPASWIVLGGLCFLCVLWMCHVKRLYFPLDWIILPQIPDSHIYSWNSFLPSLSSPVFQHKLWKSMTGWDIVWNFSWGSVGKCLLTSERAYLRLGEPISILGLLTGVWVRSCFMDDLETAVSPKISLQHGRWHATISLELSA